MKCHRCGEILEAHRRDCVPCGEDNGFPNVRKANDPNELTELKKRYNEALVSCKARNCEAVLEAFGKAVDTSRVVWARSLGVLQNLLGSETNTYVGFSRQVDAGIRQPLRNEYDLVRLQYESALFPYYAGHMIFAALSLNASGMKGYGAFSLVLKDPMIDRRTSVFEENPHIFVEKHSIVLNKPIPPGYRASWQNRGLLAQCKLHSRLSAQTKETDFPGILASDNGGTGNSDFIEAHIYGDISIQTIDTVIGREPKVKVDRLIWRSIKESLAKFGVKVLEQ